MTKRAVSTNFPINCPQGMIIRQLPALYTCIVCEMRQDVYIGLGLVLFDFQRTVMFTVVLGLVYIWGMNLNDSICSTVLINTIKFRQKTESTVV